jgi:dipeptidyl aminopeptidase/acylaminoacyl peptidase
MDAKRLTTEKVRFASDSGHDLVGLYTPDGRGSSVAVLCHGMLSSKESEKLGVLAERLHERGIAALRFDFSGRGESGGDPRRILYDQERRDLAAAVAFVRARGHGRVGLFGSSMGGAVVVLYAAQDPEVQAVATIAAVSRPALFLTKTSAGEVARWRSQGYFVYDDHVISADHLGDAERADVLGAASRLSARLLVLHGEEDRVVPVEDGRLLAEAGHGELVLFPGADHRFSRPEDLHTAIERTLAFFSAHLS